MKYFPDSNKLLAAFINATILTFLLILIINILPDTKPELPSRTQKAMELEKEASALLEKNV